MLKQLTAILMMVAAVVNAANPLGFREYEQRFTLTFANEEDAKAAVIKAQPLPANCKLAVSSRWDDTAEGHLTTHEIMVKHGVKGTFFANDVFNILKKNPSYFKLLTADGSSIGCHTKSHPNMPQIASYEHFRQFMRNRIEIETAVQQPVNSQVLPFCQWAAYDEKVALSIGWAMRATGVISSPDVMYPDRDGQLGYPPKSLAMSALLRSGDRDPDFDKFKQQMDKALANEKALAVQPSISMSMHSWCPKEKLSILDRQYALLAGHKDWWYCNQNEYGAYRYEALNDDIRQTVVGKTVIVVVRRCEPYELGADVPLWFSVENAVPLATDGAAIKFGAIELPHDVFHKLPDVIGLTDKDGQSEQIPFATLQLSHNGNKWTAKLANQDMLPLEELAFTFRFPAACRKEAIRADATSLAAHSGMEITVAQEFKPEAMYHYGRPYYAVQLDFRKGDKRYRLFVDLSEMAEDLPKTLGDVAKFYSVFDEADMSRLSIPDTAVELVAFKNRRLANPCPGLLAHGVRKDPKAFSGAKYLVAVAEFRPSKEGRLTLKTSRDNRFEYWLNGTKLEVKNGEAVFTPQAGKNRFAVKLPAAEVVNWMFINGENEACVEYLLND